MMESRQEMLSVHPMTATVTNTSRSWSHQSSVLLSFICTAVPALDDVLVREPYKNRAKTVTASTQGPSITNHTYGSPDYHFRATIHPPLWSVICPNMRRDRHPSSVRRFLEPLSWPFVLFPPVSDQSLFQNASVNRSDVTRWASIGLSLLDLAMDSWLGTRRKLITFFTRNDPSIVITLIVEPTSWRSNWDFPRLTDFSPMDTGYVCSKLLRNIRLVWMSISNGTTPVMEGR